MLSTRVLLSGIALLASLFSIHTSQAAPFATASAFIDLSTLSVQTTGSASFSLNGVDEYNGTVEVPNQFAETFTDSDIAVDHLAVDTAEVSMLADSHLSAVSVADSDGFADSFANAVLGFDVDGVGDVILSFDYSISTDLFDTADPLAFALALVSMDVGAGTDDALLDFDGSLADISDFLDGTLSVTLAVNGAASDDIFLSAIAQAQTNIAPAVLSVPLPGTAALLLPGLLMLRRVRR